jgi:hypothetical protein
LFLEPPDLVADGRLRQVQPLGGAREAAGFLDGHEGSQQRRVEIHGNQPINDESSWILGN